MGSFLSFIGPYLCEAKATASLSQDEIKEYKEYLAKNAKWDSGFQKTRVLAVESILHEFLIRTEALLQSLDESQLVSIVREVPQYPHAVNFGLNAPGSSFFKFPSVAAEAGRSQSTYKVYSSSSS